MGVNRPSTIASQSIATRRRSTLALFVTLMIATEAHAASGFPEYVPLPPQIQINPDQALQKEDVGQADIAIDAGGSTIETKQGHHYTRWFNYVPAAGEPAAGYDNGTEGRIFAALQSTLTKAGWQPVFVSDTKSSFSMHRVADGKDAWLAVKMDAPQAQVQLELIQVATAASSLALPKPAASPEKFGDQDDIPYLPPWPGSTRMNAGHGDDPLDVSVPGAGGEPQLVGNAVATRGYQGPATLSQLQFIGESREALLKAGWKVLYPADAKSVQQFGSIAAHYTSDGRDLWAKLSYQHGASLSYEVTDVGADDWSSKFAKDCRLPLYGVFFDFNKSTLKPESESTLTKAAAVLKASGGAAVEVQGHTDNVGGDDYNLKLSDARAAAVRTWLTQHGIDAARLTSKGYGKTQPVSDNGSDAGRAKNRRVELARQGCK